MALTLAALPFSANQGDALDSAAGWLVQLMTGSVAVTLAVIAVASIGLLLFLGRTDARMAAGVVIGSFVLLGAPVIATALMGFAEHSESLSARALAQPIVEPRAGLGPSNYDPYAGASLRSD